MARSASSFAAFNRSGLRSLLIVTDLTGGEEEGGIVLLRESFKLSSKTIERWGLVSDF